MAQVKITVVNSSGQELLRRIVKGGVVLTEDRTVEIKRPTSETERSDSVDGDDDYVDDTIEQTNLLTILPGRDHMIVIEDDH